MTSIVMATAGITAPLLLWWWAGHHAAVCRWWVRWREERQPRSWAPGELPRLARELSAERDWERRFWTAQQRYEANRRLREAGFHATLSGRVWRLP